METKYVIILHNMEGHCLEESPLLDSYPKKEILEYYLSQSNYSFAKVEKRYTLGSIEKIHSKLNTPKFLYEISYLTEDGSSIFFGTQDEKEFNGFLLNLQNQEIPYKAMVIKT